MSKPDRRGPRATRRRLRARALTVAAAAALSLAAPVVLAGPAAAHVTVTPDSAEAGGYATLAFKVPTERDDASTTKLEVEFPADHPFASVSTQPKTGWDVEVERAELDEPIESHGEQVTERVARVTWTASEESAQIGPGEFDTFPISVGPLPTDAEQLVFKAIQTYSGGEVVRWIEEAAEGTDVEPESPAPVLELTAAAEEDAGGDAGGGSGGDDAAAEEAGAEEAGADAELAGTSASDDLPTTNQVNTAIGLSIGAVVLALIGAGIGGAALARRGDGSTAPAGGPPAPPAGPPPTP